MTKKNFLLAGGLVSLSFGLSLIFAQDFMTRTYLTTFEASTPTIRLLGLLYGGVLLVMGIAGLLISNAPDSRARDLFMVQSILGFLVAAATHVYTISIGWETSFTWGTVVLCVALGIWGILLLRDLAD